MYTLGLLGIWVRAGAPGMFKIGGRGISACRTVANSRALDLHRETADVDWRSVRLFFLAVDHNASRICYYCMASNGRGCSYLRWRTGLTSNNMSIFRVDMYRWATNIGSSISWTYSLASCFVIASPDIDKRRTGYCGHWYRLCRDLR